MQKIFANFSKNDHKWNKLFNELIDAVDGTQQKDDEIYFILIAFNKKGHSVSWKKLNTLIPSLVLFVLFLLALDQYNW